MKLFLLTIIAVFLFAFSDGSHFRGGTISWKPTEISRQIEISYRFAWRLNYEPHFYCTEEAIQNRQLLDGEGQLVISKNIDGEERADIVKNKLNYVCTDRSEIGDDAQFHWASGVNTFLYDVPENYGNEFDLRFASCCWVRVINYDSPRKWNMVTKVNILPRVDTMRPNSSPKTSSLPLLRIQQGCEQMVDIPHYDPDGDEVRCRWSELDKNECSSPNCGRPHDMFFLVDGHSCVMGIDARNREPGWYAVSVMMEDFISPTSVTPLSSVPFHFLVKVEVGDRECADVRAIEPSESCIAVHAGVEFKFKARAITSTREMPIVDFETTKPEGMTKSDVLAEEGGIYAMDFTWTPPASSNGDVETLCYAPIDSNNFFGLEKCVEFAIGGTVPQANPYLSTPSINKTISPMERIWEIHFDQNVVLNDSPSLFIAILFMNNTVMYNIDVSSDSGNTSISKDRPNILQYILPDNMPLLQEKTEYQLRVHRGIVAGMAQCHVLNAPQVWTFNTSELIMAGLRPQSIKKNSVATQCFPTFMETFIDRDMLGSVDPAFITMTDPYCYGMYFNDTHFVIGSTYGKCGTRAIVNEDQTRVSMINVIRIPYPYDVADGSALNYEIHVNCSISTRRVAYVEFNPNVTTIKIKQDNLGEFNFSLKMFPGEDYRQPYRIWDFPIDVQEKQRLFFEARTFAMRGYAPFLNSCVATPTANPGGSLRYEFIKDGCGLESTVIFHRSPKYSRVRFSIEAFAFLVNAFDSTVFVHCDLRLCQVAGGGCENTCADKPDDKRRKRGTYTFALSDEFMDTDGPIRIIHNKSGPSNFDGIPQSSSWIFYNEIYLSVISTILFFISAGLLYLLWKIRKTLRNLTHDVTKSPLPVLTMKS